MTASRNSCGESKVFVKPNSPWRNKLKEFSDPLTPLPLDATQRNLVRALRLSVTVIPADDEIERNWTMITAIRNDPRGI